MNLLPILNVSLALAGLLIAGLAIVLYVDLFLYKGQYCAAIVKKFAFPVVMALTIGSVAMTLLYSEYFGFVPCSLCWLQRIAMYPQALIAVLAFRSRDIINFPVYGIGLSVFGLLVAGYHYVYQSLPKETLSSGVMPCLLDGSNADCAVKVMDVFGFITFPFLSAATFAFLIAVYLYLLRSNKN